MNPFEFQKSLKIGEKTTIVCELKDGSLPVTFVWMKDGHRFFGDEISKIDTEEDYSTIRFKSISSKDIGNYTCSASNSYGMDGFTAELLVKSELPMVYKEYSNHILLTRSTNMGQGAKRYRSG